MRVPLLDLRAQHAQVRDEVDAAVREVFETQRFILGPTVEAFEARVASYSQCEHGVGMSSGTDALLAALMADGIGAGDEVITTAFSFFATAGVVQRVGARPVFVDIEADSFNLDPTRIEAAITPRTRAIMPVHLFGQMAEMDAIMELARRRGLLVIEDAAQAIGAEYQGRRAGSIGDSGCFSFFPSKNLGAAGDAGMVVCKDSARAERLRCMRGHGARTKYFHDVVGGNFRIDALQAAVLAVKLGHLDRWTEQRQLNAKLYREGLRASGCSLVSADASLGPRELVLPAELPQRRHIYNQFVIRVQAREALRAHLNERGIGSEVYYPRPFHLQHCFAHLGHRRGDFPRSERACDEVLALPIYPELSGAQIAYVVDSVCDFLRKRG